VWLGGFRSEMTATKASHLDRWAAREGRALLRFDYFAHGQSTGDWRAATVTRWRDDALAVIDALTDGPLVLAGSSMGGWLACLAALARPERVKAMVLTAPAADFTSALMEPSLPDEARAALARDGLWVRPSAYDPAGYPITRTLLEDGRKHTILNGGIPLPCPVHILHGDADLDVPWQHGLKLHERLQTPRTVFTLIKGGDHRLSAPDDLALLERTVADMCRKRTALTSAASFGRTP
jgi:pimeloyl-ACP methyl ester carboxylesterase